MNTRRKTPMSSGGDYSATIPPRPTAAKTAAQPRFETSATSGIQTVHAYRPPENELWYIEALYMLLEHGILPRETVFSIDCVQLRKASGAEAIGTTKDIEHCRWLAEQFDVDPVF